MPTFVIRLTTPRPSFALDMSDEEREIMGRHAAHWQPFIEAGRMAVFGPIRTARARGASASSRPTGRTRSARTPPRIPS